jgi:hypothetical protein
MSRQGKAPARCAANDGYVYDPSYAYGPGYSYGQSYGYDPGYSSAPAPVPPPCAQGSYDRYGNPIPGPNCYSNQRPYPPPQQQNYNPNQRPYPPPPQYAQPQQYYDPNQPQLYGR